MGWICLLKEKHEEWHWDYGVESSSSTEKKKSHENVVRIISLNHGWFDRI